jgi:hypothetical protein
MASELIRTSLCNWSQNYCHYFDSLVDFFIMWRGVMLSRTVASWLGP